MDWQEVDPVDELLKFVATFPRQTDAALALGISKQYLSRMVRRRDDVSPRTLRQLGLRRTVIKTTTPASGAV